MKKIHKNHSLSPWYITGFVNTDGCFSVHIEKDKATRFGYRIKPVFSITQHQNSKHVLEAIQEYFQCGKCILQHRSCLNYRVTNREHLRKYILPHFQCYPLKSEKFRQFVVWSHILDLVEKKIHWSCEGFLQILEILHETTSSQKRRDRLDDIINQIRPPFMVHRQKIDVPSLFSDSFQRTQEEWTPDFVTGLIDGDGCFSVSTRKSGRIDVSFSFVQSRESQDLVFGLHAYFQRGNVYYPTKTTIRYTLWKAQDLFEIFSLHFETSPLHTKKRHAWLRVSKICVEKMKPRKIS